MSGEEAEAHRCMVIAVALVRASAKDERSRRILEDSAADAALTAAKLFAAIDATTTPEEEDPE